MERALKSHRSAPTALLSPGYAGWNVTANGAGLQTAQTLQEACALAPAGSRIALALPSNLVLMERLKLPSTDPAELSGMVRLQLEKTLPFALDEITSDYEVISQDGKETSVLAVAVNNQQLGAFCEPLRRQSRLPSRITVFAMHVARTCPEDKVVLLVYREQDKHVAAICEHAKLSYVQTFDAANVDALMVSLPQALMSAELAGASTNFSSVLLDSTCTDLKEPLFHYFNLPVRLITADATAAGPRINLLPSAWELESRRLERSAKLKSRLIAASVIYILLFACLFAYLWFLRMRLSRVESQIAAQQPEMEFVQARQARWTALAPAIEPSHYPIEVLYQIHKSIPDEGVRITQFDQSLRQFMIEGEAPTANLAIQFGEQLKKNPGLADYKFEMGPPTILPNEHAQFRFFGKL